MEAAAAGLVILVSTGFWLLDSDSCIYHLTAHISPHYLNLSWQPIDEVRAGMKCRRC